MDSKAPRNSDLVESVRNMAVSRRGGARTRGGRLPPIRMREITQVTGNKKSTVAPNIPQRRRIKQEPETSAEKLQIKTEPKNDFQNSRDRGRGRQPKVFLQTEGTFLAEGPALKIKRDPIASESYSFHRASKTGVSEGSIATFDVAAIKELLESSGDEEQFEDAVHEMRPYCLPPLAKKKSISKKKIKPDIAGDGINNVIKTEPKDDDGIKVIKTEPDDNDDVKRIIKAEPVDDEDDDEYGGITRGKIKIKKELESDSEDDEKKYSLKLENDPKVMGLKNITEKFQNMEGDEMMVLLQIPRFASSPEAEKSEGSSKKENKRIELEPEQISTFIDNLEEGFVGKLKIMKSGKMKIALGSMEFDLFEGNPLDSYWEAVSIQLRDDGADLAVLGKLERKMIMCPVMRQLLTKNRDLESDCIHGN